MTERPLAALAINRVSAAVSAAHARRRERLTMAQGIRHPEFARQLTALRYALDESAADRNRSSPFAPLDEYELGLLDRQMDEYENAGRLEILTSVDPIQYSLAMLRLNQVIGEPILAPPMFRDIATAMFGAAMIHVLAFLTPCQVPGRREVGPEGLVLVLPWRAALLAGECYRSQGAVHFWHIGAARDERTLQPSVYYERAAPEHTREHMHCIIDPMLATGGTAAAAIERLLSAGVIQDSIVLHSVIAAPEGVDFLLRTYPRIRIIMCALDERLNERGYITGTGLGDFGDLAFADIDAAYAQEHWVTPGLLTADEADRIVERTRGTHCHTPSIDYNCTRVTSRLS